jgi:hypothetical protein
MRRSLWWPAALAVFFLFARPAAGQAGGDASEPPLGEALSGPAKEAYEAATVLLNNRDPSRALDKYRQAYELSRDPRLLFDMAVCARDLRSYAKMRGLLLDYERATGTSLRPERRADVDAALAAIHNLVGTWNVSVNEAGASVAVDGEPRGETPLAAPLVLDLGKHTLAAGAVVGGYFLFQSHDSRPSSPPADITVVLPRGSAP